MKNWVNILGPLHVKIKKKNLWNIRRSKGVNKIVETYVLEFLVGIYCSNHQLLGQVLITNGKKM